MTETIRFHFDPACPWAWQGARWIAEVRTIRPIHVEWRLFSLFLINEHHEELEPIAQADAGRDHTGSLPGHCVECGQPVGWRAADDAIHDCSGTFYGDGFF